MGVEHALQNEDFLIKSRETNMRNLGVPHPSYSYDVYLKSCASKNEIPRSEESFKITNIKENFIEFVDYVSTKLNKKPNIDELARELGIQRTRMTFIVRKFEVQDMIQYLAGESYGEYEIIELLKNHGIRAHHRYSKLGPEMDIYLEKYDIGIEFTGLYWHSSKFKEKDYHYDKYKYYNDVGTRLIHIYEDDWNDDIKSDIVKSQLLHECGKISLDSTLNANDLELVDPDDTQDNFLKISEFMVYNNMDGIVDSTINLALMLDDEIIEMMSFKPSEDTNYQFELVAHFTKVYHKVLGGKERLFKYFLSEYQNKQKNFLVTHIDIDLKDEREYLSLGFKLFNHSIPVWGLEENFTKRISRNPKNNAYFKTLPKIYGAGNNTYVY